MKSSKIISAGFISVAALLSGLTVATAQTAPANAPAQVEATRDGFGAQRADFRPGREGRGGPGGMMGQIMQQADANGDSAVTQNEIDAFRAGLVTDADSSGDGNISLEEFETVYLTLNGDRMVDAFQNLDADGDGSVTEAELDARFGNIVARMDRNDDGQLDREDRGGRDKRGQDRDGRRHGDHRK